MLNELTETRENSQDKRRHATNNRRRAYLGRLWVNAFLGSVEDVDGSLVTATIVWRSDRQV